MGILSDEEKKYLLDRERVKTFQINWVRTVKKPFQKPVQIKFSTLVESKWVADIIKKDLERVSDVKDVEIIVIDG